MPAADVFSKNICSGAQHQHCCHAVQPELSGQRGLVTLLQQQNTLCHVVPTCLLEATLDMNILDQTFHSDCGAEAGPFTIELYQQRQSCLAQQQVL